MARKVSCLFGIGFVTASVMFSNLAAASGKYVFTTIDPPNIGSMGTIALFINRYGEMGGYSDLKNGNGALQAFFRTTNGKFQTFFAPDGSHNIYTRAFNDQGTVVGEYQGVDFKIHGFLRKRHGEIDAIDVPGSLGTQAVAINAHGAIAGNGAPGGGGFIRWPSGEFTTFGPVGPYGSHVTAINDAGEIAGTYYIDSNQNSNSYKRGVDGAITVFAVPDSIITLATSIDGDGEVGGYYVDSLYVPHGFIRLNDGSFSTFDPPNSGWTIVNSLTTRGRAAGSFNDLNHHAHGFVRSAQGKITTIDFPGETSSGIWQAGPRGSAVGTYVDSQHTYHGFLMSHSGTLDSPR